jgi:peptidoglycan hydrolase-like protein with peptidoglycan-binding domain
LISLVVIIPISSGFGISLIRLLIYFYSVIAGIVVLFFFGVFTINIAMKIFGEKFVENVCLGIWMLIKELGPGVFAFIIICALVAFFIGPWTDFWADQGAKPAKAIKNLKESRPAISSITKTSDDGNPTIVSEMAKPSSDIPQETRSQAKMDTASAQPSLPQRPPSREEILQAQKRLQALGFNPGPIDGVLGRSTQGALRQFQQAQGLSVAGTLDETTLKVLGISSIQPSKSSSDAPASNPASVRFDGLYRALRDSGATFLRFHKDGRVYLTPLGVGAEGAAKVETAKKVMQWIDNENREVLNKGTYSGLTPYSRNTKL